MGYYVKKKKMSMNITSGSAPIPEEVFYIESVCRQEPIDVEYHQRQMTFEGR